MIQINWIKDWCKEKGFKFVNCNDGKFPSKEDDQTFYIKGFNEGSRSISFSYGSLKMNLKLKVQVQHMSYAGVKKHILPDQWICPRCNKKNLNLSTDDGHKTYVCSACYGKKEEIENAKKLKEKFEEKFEYISCTLDSGMNHGVYKDVNITFFLLTKKEKEDIIRKSYRRMKLFNKKYKPKSHCGYCNNKGEEIK